MKALTRTLAVLILSASGAACLPETEAPVEVSPDPVRCVSFGHADVDPTLGNLKQMGWTIDYSGGRWTVSLGEATLTGTAAAEDEGADLCGNWWAAEVFAAEQRAICAAGNDEVCALS